MRGACTNDQQAGYCSGITPAHAGSIGRPIYNVGSYRDHPRACGEHTGGALGLTWGLGSPPRMRGAYDKPIFKGRVPGITPAHAGSIFLSASLIVRHQDHPRACGEHRPGNLQCRTLWGSPPRMRGAYLLPGGVLMEYWITPAHAGSISLRSKMPPLAGDHPRACGEHRTRTITRLPGGGSPPRMRGACRAYNRFSVQVRITPAHAGSISWIPS